MWARLTDGMRVRNEKTLILLGIWLVVWAVAPLALVRMLFAIFTAPDKAWLIAVTFDKLANVASNGNPNQTISYRAAASCMQGRAWGCILCKLLDKLDPGHCASALNDRRQGVSDGDALAEDRGCGHVRR